MKNTRLMVCITYESQPSLIFEEDPRIVARWFDEHGIISEEWYNETNVCVFGFNVKLEEDFVAAKLTFEK